MSDVTINININDDEPKVSILKKPQKKKGPLVKKKTRKLKNGKETTLQLPETVTGEGQRSPILDMIGV